LLIYGEHPLVYQVPETYLTITARAYPQLFGRFYIFQRRHHQLPDGQSGQGSTTVVADYQQDRLHRAAGCREMRQMSVQAKELWHLVCILPMIWEGR
jgi:hypothetical protein